MKKHLFAILAAVCLLTCGAILFMHSGVAYAATSNDVVWESGIYEFQPVMDNFTYGLNDEIPLSFKIESDSPVLSVEYDTYGFNVISKPVLAKNYVSAKIVLNQANRVLGNLKFTVYANLENGGQLEASICGIIENGTLYINGNSFDAARDIYFSEMLASDTMTDREYELALRDFLGNSDESYDFVQTRANETWVTGTLQWEDDAGNLHPLQYTKVTIYDEGGGLFGWWDTNLGNTYTNVNGVFSFEFSNNSGGQNIFIKVYPEGENSIVETGTGGDHVWRSATTSNVTTGSTITINRIFNMRDTGTTIGGVAGDGDLGRAFQISQSVIVAARYVKAMRGSNISDITIRYPDTSGSGCYYQSNKIYITNNVRVNTSVPHSYASWDVIMHEYGHHVQHKLGLTDSPGGSHSFTQNLADTYGKSAGNRLAWGEAYPSVFGGMAQSYYSSELKNIATVGDTSYTSYNGASINYNTTTTRNGEAVEASIIGVLWDLYDNDTTEAHDNISLGHSSFWTLMIGSQAKTFSAFTNHYYSAYSSTTNRDNFGKLIQYYRMAPENITHSGDLTNHDLPTFSWTANGTSSSLQNNKFDLIFYNPSRTQVLKIENITTTSRQLTSNEWNTVLSGSGASFFVAVVGYQTGSPLTGGYTSGFTSFDKPLFVTQLNGNNITITGVTNGVTLTGSVLIPEFLNGRTVTQIGNSVFAGQGQLTHITIPNSVTNLNNNIFHNNTSVYWLDNYAFRDNIFLESLNEQAEFTVPDIIAGKTVIQIGDYAFADKTSLTKITIPSSVAYIGNHAFSNCKDLSQVDITDETTSILGSTPFSGCPQLYGTILSIKSDYHRIIDSTGRLIWMAHDFVYDGNHSSTHHDLVCQSCGYEDTKDHNKQVVNGVEVCTTCPWIGDIHINHEHTHSYIPIPHSGKIPVNKHKAYCYCGEYIEEMCLGKIESDGKAYCIYCHRDMSGALGPIINRIPESEFHDHDICCTDNCHLNDCCITKDDQFFSEPNNVLYIDINRREKNFYNRN